MATLGQALGDSTFQFAATRIGAVILAMPLLVALGHELWPYISAMSPAEAVVIFGVIGGASGIVSQYVAAAQMGKMDRSYVNAVELIPAVIASVLASGVVTYALVPPQPNPATAYLQSTGRLPS